MHRFAASLLVAMLVGLVSWPALASVTWYSTNLTSAAVCTSGDETAAPPTTNPCTTEHGLCLKGLSAFEVHVEADAAMTAGGVLEIWFWRPGIKASSSSFVAGQWNRAPALDITVTAEQDETYPAFVVPVGVGGVALIPNGTDQPSSIYIFGTR